MNITVSQRAWGWRRLSQRLLVIAVAASLGACGLFLSEAGQLERALKAQRSGDLRAASIDLKSLLEKNPQNTAARFHLGVVTLAQGDAAAAVRELERARDAGYREPNTTEPLARAYLALGQHDKGLQLVDAQLGAGGTSADASADTTRVALLLLRGELLAAQGRMPEAKAAFEQALEIAPKNIPGLLGLAQLVAATDGPTAALAVTDRALTAAPKDADVHRSRGSLFLAAGQAESAIAAFQEATAGGGSKSDLLLGLGGLTQSQLAAGKVKDALTTTERMQKVAAESPLTRYMRAYALVQDGQLEPARVLLEQNVVNQADLRSRILLGAVNLAQGRLGQAEMYLASSVAAAPSNGLARQLLAETRLRQSKPADAMEALAPAVDGESANANMLALAARASIAAGQPQQGVDYLRRNAKQNPKSLDAKLDLAAGYLAAGQFDRALAELEAAGGGKPGEGKPDGGKQGVDDPVTLSDAQELRSEYLAVLARIKKGDSAGAVAHAASVADAKPQNAALQTLASSVYAMQGQFVLARKYAEAVTRLQPDDAGGYLALGRIELLQNQPEPASKFFRTALEKQPGNVTAASALAMIELAGQRPQPAIEIIDTALKHNPNSVDLRILKTQTLLSMGNLEAAEKMARDLVALAEPTAPTLTLLGRVLGLRQKYSEAIETFDRAVRAAPTSAPIRYQLAMTHRAAGNREQALAATKDALQIDARYLPAVNLAAQLSLSGGDMASAGQHIDALLKMAPEQSSSHALLGELRMAQKRYPDAATAFHRAGELLPSLGAAIRESQARRLARVSDPIAPLAAFVRAHPDNMAALLALAEEYQAGGNRPLALQAYENAIAQQPKNATALNNLAWMRFEDGHPDALPLAKRAHEAAPQAIAITDTYAWVLINSNQSAAGLKLLEPLFLPKANTSKDNTSTAGATKSALPAEIVAHYAVALARSGRDNDARRVAAAISEAQMRAFDPKLQAMLAPLTKASIKS